MSNFQNDIVDGVLQFCAGMEITEPDAVATIAVDRTLREVLHFLSGQCGDVRYAVEELEQMTGIEL